MDYRLVTYANRGRPVAGILLDDDTVVPADALLGAGGPTTVEDMLERWDEVRPILAERARRPSTGLERTRLAQLNLLAPLTRPGQLFIAGSNYRDHIQEMAKRDAAAGHQRAETKLDKPYHAFKGSRACVVGPNARVAYPVGCTMLDWEAELAVIIGKHAAHVPVERALEHVAGYTIANDLSARNFSRRPDAEKGSTFHVDWISHKSFAGACPLGPWIVPREAVADPHSLYLKLWVNDELRQDSNTSNMIFGVPEQIAYLSTRIPLFPGDVILTGTPGGNGSAWGKYLQKGDTVRVQIERLGELVTHIG